MNKNKKLVSFVCAIAMIITMLSSFTFVSAAEEGFTLSTPVVSSDGKTITFDVGYTNITSGISSGRFKINMPEEVTAVAAAASLYFQQFLIDINCSFTVSFVVPASDPASDVTFNVPNVCVSASPTEM